MYLYAFGWEIYSLFSHNDGDPWIAFYTWLLCEGTEFRVSVFMYNHDAQAIDQGDASNAVISAKNLLKRGISNLFS